MTMSETAEDSDKRRASRSFDVFLTQHDGFEILEMEESQEPDRRLTAFRLPSEGTRCEPIKEDEDYDLPNLPTAGSSKSDGLGISTATAQEPRRSHFIEDLKSALASGPEDAIQATNGSQGLLDPAGGIDNSSREAGVCHELQSHEPGEESAFRNEEPKPCSEQHKGDSKFATELYTVSYLIIFSILGTLARLGLSALTFYPGAPVETGVLWANFSGSFFMGFLSEDRKLFRARSRPVPQKERRADEENVGSSNDANAAAVKKKIPLYIGLATGFCGSFTSFSSFIRDAYLALSNTLPVPVSHTSSSPIDTSSNIHRNPGYSFMAVLAVIITTTFLSLAGLQLGAHLTIGIDPCIPSLHTLFAPKLFNRIMVFVAFGSWLGAIFMTIWPSERQEKWRSQALLALIFAPLGCLLRFYASLYLNPKITSFPLGTFGVNMLGTALMSLFYDLQHSHTANHGLGCEIFQGAMDGFCGCLTTISTWVAELHALGQQRRKKRQAYFYGGVSVSVGLGLAVVILGSLQWTQGFQRPVCAR